MDPASVDAALVELAFEHLPIPAVLLDGDDRLLRANAAAREAFGALEPGAPLDALAGKLELRRLEGVSARVGCLLSADEERVAALVKGTAETGSIAHDLKNAGTAVSLSLRAVARALGEDEREVLEDLHRRLQGVEIRLRAALAPR